MESVSNPQSNIQQKAIEGQPKPIPIEAEVLREEIFDYTTCSESATVPDRVRKLKELRAEIPENFITETAKRSLREYVAKGYIFHKEEFLGLLEDFDLKIDELKTDKDMLIMAKAGILVNIALNEEWSPKLENEIASTFGISPESIEKGNVTQDELQVALVYLLTYQYRRNLSKFDGTDSKLKVFCTKYSIPESMLESAAKEACIKTLRESLGRFYLDDYKEFVSPPEVPYNQDDMLEGYRTRLLHGDMSDPIEFIKLYEIPEEIVHHPRAVEAAEHYIARSERISRRLIRLSEIYSISLETKQKMLSNFSGPSGLSFEKIVEIYNTPQIGERLVDSIRELGSSFSFKEHVEPVLKSQGDAAFLYFEEIKRMPQFKNHTLSDEEIDFICYLSKKYNVRARNILTNIVVKVPSIASEMETIDSYISDIGLIDYSIFQRYKYVKDDPERLKILQEQVRELQDKVYKGEVRSMDFSNPLYPAVIYNTFPPAIGLVQDQYDRLSRGWPDRRSDVPAKLNDLQYKSFSVQTGKYSLHSGEELNLESWNCLREAVSKVNKEVEENKNGELNYEEVAQKLISFYKEKSGSLPENQSYVFEQMYRYHLAHNGEKLPEDYELNLPGLMQYKEFIGDRIKNELVKDCLIEWGQHNQNEFEELKKDVVNRLKNTQDQNYAKVKSLLSQIKKHSANPDKQEKSIATLNDFLKDFGYSYEQIKDKNLEDLKRFIESVPVEWEEEGDEYRSEEFYNSPGFLAAFDTFSSRYDENELVYRKISSDLVAETNKEMRKELDKFEFETEEGHQEEKELEFVISKKKEHCVAGYNMGVCTAPKEELWNDRNFMFAIIFDPEIKQAQGGMHLLVYKDSLCLPGVNPSLDLISKSEINNLYDEMINYARNVKEKLGLKRILIPKSTGIHSNRIQIQNVIRNKNYPEYSLPETVKFAHTEFKDCFVVS